MLVGVRRSVMPPQLPHHRLVAYQIAVELLLDIKAAKIRDAKPDRESGSRLPAVELAIACCENTRVR